jgi:hypothetical protein
LENLSKQRDIEGKGKEAKGGRRSVPDKTEATIILACFGDSFTTSCKILSKRAMQWYG